MNLKIADILILFTLILPSGLAWSYEPPTHATSLSSDRPQEIQNVGITEKLGEKIDLKLEFTNDAGENVLLGKYFQSSKPVMLAMVYYSCPNLCNFQLNGLIETLQKMKGTAGEDYEVVAVSMDSDETSSLAAAKKEKYMTALGQVGAEKGWHFLVGDTTNVSRLAEQIGFGFKWNPEIEQFAHAAATIIVTSSGMISRYHNGISYSPETMRMSLVEASDGHVGSFIEQFALYCFQFNPAKNKYTLYAYNIMRIGAAFTAIVMALFLLPLWLRERQRKANMA